MMIRLENFCVKLTSVPHRVLARMQMNAQREAGQALTEYLLLVIFVALVCIPIVKLLPAAVLGYVRPFYYCLSRPLP